jgi:SAM-dependent methyltransferase
VPRPTAPEPELISSLRLRTLWSSSPFRANQSAFLERVGPRFTGRVVELGGERQYHHERFFPRADEYVLSNVARDHDIRVDVTDMPFADGSQDGFVCVSVLEHVSDPALAVAEARRCLRPGGLLAVAVPFLYPVHDEVDWWRPTPSGLRALLGRFEVDAVYHLGGKASTIVEMLQRPRGTWNRRTIAFKLAALPIAALGRFDAVDTYPTGLAVLCHRPADGP